MPSLTLAMLLLMSPSAEDRRALPEASIVKTPDVTLHFDAVCGPSGLGGIDVFMTSDEGITWDKVKDHVSVQLPPIGPSGVPAAAKVTVRLPREGLVYGLHVAGVSKVGLSSGDPKPGDVPQVRVELDTQAPVAEMFMPAADPKRPDHIILSWKVTDRNLAVNPITIEWSETPKGPWQPIWGPQLPNALHGEQHPPGATGSHVWHITGQIPAQAYLRLTVRDRAGNVSRAETKQPVPLDVVKPRIENVRLAEEAKGLPAPPPPVESKAEAPIAELFTPSPDPVRQGRLVLSWKCSGQNLAVNPISLEWAGKPEGPWTFIGGPRLPNENTGSPCRPDATGTHGWKLPEQIPPQVYLRLTVRDKAGRTTVAATGRPLLLYVGRPIPGPVRIEDE